MWKTAANKNQNINRMSLYTKKGLPYRAVLLKITREHKKGIAICDAFSSPYGNRTRVFAVRGRRLNRLTNEPFIIITERGTDVKSFLTFFNCGICVPFRCFGSLVYVKQLRMAASCRLAPFAVLHSKIASLPEGRAGFFSSLRDSRQIPKWSCR